MPGELAGSDLRVAGLPVLAPAGREPEPWWQTCADELTDRLATRNYPCHFGRAAMVQGELFASFFDGPGGELATPLRHFLTVSQERLDRRMVLAAFLRPEDTPRDEAWYESRFWQVLQELHGRDESPWPAGTPTRPEHPDWEFSFGGVQMFVFAAAPTYRHRLSRSLGPGLVLLFQPRNVFTGVEGGTPGGVRARRAIRRRLAEWDSAPPHPDLGDYGDPSNNEWRQYFIPDGTGRLREQCPLHIGEGGASSSQGT